MSEENSGYAPGFTAFMTKKGLDLKFRTEAGEEMTRLSTRLDKRTLSGAIHEPGMPKDEAPLAVAVQAVSGVLLLLTCGNRTWELRRQPKGHFFAHMSQWPEKADPVDDVDAMFAALDEADKTQAKGKSK